ncbi:hypothetical protein ACFPN2_09390 [Steroidobacter flavus]|uniref:Uncharacterized protein n=1 Tax=Steroidobacter flavus TaxID=1842136 RepID=A0ABV8SP81_9GAMM
MKRFGKAPALLALLIASTLTGADSLADPLHKYGNEGAWCHVDSGWMFPESVGGFARVLQPYSIDGNSDAAGAEYRQASGPLQGAVEVDVYGIDSMAADANIDGAKATAAGKAGEGAKIESEKPFKLGAAKGLQGVKIKYAADAGERTNLYYFTTDRWHVKVLAKGTGKESDKALDAFVQALPWNTLGTNPGIH